MLSGNINLCDNYLDNFSEKNLPPHSLGEKNKISQLKFAKLSKNK